MRAALRKPASSPIRAPPGKISFGSACRSALGDGTCAVGDALAALEEGLDLRMQLVALEFLEGLR
jgi:hypothetical protein